MGHCPDHSGRGSFAEVSGYGFRRIAPMTVLTTRDEEHWGDRLVASLGAAAYCSCRLQHPFWVITGITVMGVDMAQ